MGWGQRTAAPETVPYLRRSLDWVRPGRSNQVYLSSGEVYHKGFGQVIFHFRNIQGVGLLGKCTCCEQQVKRGCESNGLFHTETPHSSRLYSLLHSTWLAKRMLTTSQVMVMHILMLVILRGLTTTGRYGFHLSHSRDKLYSNHHGAQKKHQSWLWMSNVQSINEQWSTYGLRWRGMHLNVDLCAHWRQYANYHSISNIYCSFRQQYLVEVKANSSMDGSPLRLNASCFIMREFTASAARPMAPTPIGWRERWPTVIFASIDAVASILQIPQGLFSVIPASCWLQLSLPRLVPGCLVVQPWRQPPQKAQAPKTLMLSNSLYHRLKTWFGSVAFVEETNRNQKFTSFLPQIRLHKELETIELCILCVQGKYCYER